MSSEQQAREDIDRLLAQAGWAVRDLRDANISAHRGVAIREFPCPATASPIICSMTACKAC